LSGITTQAGGAVLLITTFTLPAIGNKISLDTLHTLCLIAVFAVIKIVTAFYT